MSSDFRLRPITKTAWLALFACRALLVSAAGTEAGAVELPPRPEAWVLSTRSVPLSCPSGVDPSCFSWQRLQDDCSRWVPSNQEEFLESESAAAPLVVFIHGNRSDRCDAIADGLPVFRKLKACSGNRLFRLVIWSWPSGRIRGGPRYDAQVKAARSDVQSHYLAAWLDRLPPESPVLLIGYSFGARIITGALQLAEGGTVGGWPGMNAVGTATNRPLRVMLIAAALDSEWLLPGSRNGMAWNNVDQILITRNCQDPVLRLYPRMNRCDRSSALGLAGPAGSNRLLGAGMKFETVPVECQVGRNHSWDIYLASSAVSSRLAWYAFLVDPFDSGD